MSEKKQLIINWSVTVMAGFICFIIFSVFFFRVLDLPSPKTARLERRNSALRSEMQILSRRMDYLDRQLNVLEMRDNDIYRQILGSEAVPEEERCRAFPQPEQRYAYLSGLPYSETMLSSALRLDAMTRKAAIQSRSYEDLSEMSLHAADMASSVPYFNPLDMASGRIMLSSSFGYRFHPIFQVVAMHTGVDLAGPEGEPVYATGDGTVEAVNFDVDGYGIHIVIDHGFGYKTRYAHLRLAHVYVGQQVHRGDQIAQMGSTGRSTGPHLHYEVIYAGNRVNPMLFLNEDTTEEEYLSLVHPKEEGY